MPGANFSIICLYIKIKMQILMDILFQEYNNRGNLYLLCILKYHLIYICRHNQKIHNESDARGQYKYHNSTNF